MIAILENNELMKLASALIVEDDAFTQATLTSALSAHGIDILLSTNTAKSALDLLEKEVVDVALLDLDLGAGPNGIDIAVALRRKMPNIGIIFLTSYSDPRLIGETFNVLPIGSRYITKSGISNIKTLINLILQTKQNPLQKVSFYKAKKVDLTKQQIEIIRLIAAGYTSNKISSELKISEKTVESIISKINKNLGISKLDQKNIRVQLVNAYYSMIGKKN